MTDATERSDLEILDLQKCASPKIGISRRSGEPRQSNITARRVPARHHGAVTPVLQEPDPSVEMQSAEPSVLDRLYRSLAEVTSATHQRTARLRCGIALASIRRMYGARCAPAPTHSASPKNHPKPTAKTGVGRSTTSSNRRKGMDHDCHQRTDDVAEAEYRAASRYRLGPSASRARHSKRRGDRARECGSSLSHRRTWHRIDIEPGDTAATTRQQTDAIGRAAQRECNSFFQLETPGHRRKLNRSKS